MTPELLQWICCPTCRGDLVTTAESTASHGIETGRLDCESCGASYPITRGVPRFVGSDGYVQSFSYEWNRWNRVQLDTANGTTESEDTFIEKTGLGPEDVRGKLVLDVGCGAGRFSDIVNRWGGRVVGIDYSFAVEAAQRNLAPRGGVDILQADVFHLPFRDGVFDVIFSLGVLHHTQDTKEAFLCLPALLKDRGQIAVWLYYYPDALYRKASDFWRAIFSRVPSRLAYAWCWLLVTLFSGLYQSPLMRRAPFWHLPRVLPVNTHPDFKWRVLDTFDWWTPVYQDKTCSPAKVMSWFAEAGLRNVELLSYPTSVRGIRDEALEHPQLRTGLPRLDGRYVVFGAGAGGARTLAALERQGLGAQVVALCDNSPGKLGQVVHGHRVCRFDSLERNSFDFVVIASLPGREAIARQLAAAGLEPSRHFGTAEVLLDPDLPLVQAYLAA